MQKGKMNLGCIGVVAIVGFLIFQMMSSGGTVVAPGEQTQIEAPAQVEEASTNEEAADEAELIVDEATLMDDITINDVRWTVLEAAEIGPVLADEIEAEGTFVGLRFEVENGTSDPLTMLGVDLLDSEERQYAYITEALPYVDEGEACETVVLEPGDTVTCTAIYDVEADASGFQARLTDLNMLGGDFEVVDLPLE